MTPNQAAPAGETSPSDDLLNPLPGERGIPDVARRHQGNVSKKAVVAAIVLIGSLIVMVGVSIHRFTTAGKSTESVTAKRPTQQPRAAAAESRRLDLALPPPAAAGPARIPALEPLPQEKVEPIPLRTGTAPAVARISPEDAPVLLWSSRAGWPRHADASGADANDGGPGRAAARNLQDAQRRTQQLLDNLIKRTEPPPAGGIPPALEGRPLQGGEAPTASAEGLFGEGLAKSSTPKARASHLAPRSLLLPKGSSFTCTLKNRIVSATAGMVGCQVQRNVYSEDGRVLLVERGSHLDGEYRVTTVKPGTVRIPLLWTRLRTPHGITVELDSPGTGPLGESGADGHIDNRWGERIGAALLLSLIDDSVRVVIANQAGQSQGSTVVLSSTTDTGSKLAEKVLESTIGIPPVISQHQGAIVGVHVARDVDFSSVYQLRPVARESSP